MGYAFPKSFRLRSRDEFQRVYREGVRVYTRFFTIHGMRNSLGRPRLGVTVTKKVGKACVRNRWKRLIREAFRLNRHTFPSIDMVVTVKRGVDPPAFRELEEDLVKGVFKLAKKITG